jgi:hypothetical protein
MRSSTRARLFAAFAICSACWSLLVWWTLRADPWHRLVLASHAGRLIGRDGQVVLLGDSIMKSVGSPCAGFVNLALPGARARDVPDELVGEAARLKPAVILVMMGINDLRMGDGPADSARSVAALARRLRAAAPAARIVVLAPLPITHNEIAWAANNDAVREMAEHLRNALQDGALETSDFSSLFGKSGLAPELTQDGLHLNGAGVARFSTLVQAVAVAAGAQGCR